MNFIFYLGLFCLPFVFWPEAIIPYEIPRVWFLQRWIEILGMVGIWKFAREKAVLKKKNDSFLILSVFAFAVMAIVSSWWGVDFNKSFWGNYYRGDGLFTLFHLIALFFLLILFWEQSWKESTIAVLALGSGLISIWTLFLGLKMWILGGLPAESWLWGGYSFGKAIGATFGQPNFLAGYLLVTLPFMAYFLKDKRDWVKWLALMGLISQAGAIGLTLSRAGVLGILFFGIGWLTIGKIDLRRKATITAGIILIMIIFLIVLASFGPPKSADFVAESRERIFTKAILGFVKKPALGWGWANFDYAFESSDWPYKLNRDVYVDKAHSGLMEVLVTTGILGFLVYLTIILVVLKKLLLMACGKGQWGKVLLMVFLLFLFHSQTNVISVAEEFIFWLVLGIVEQAEKC